jgi:response regulator of citrate/malate metabolism
MHNGNSKPIKCIIVDDEPMARDIIRRYIEKVPTLQLAGNVAMRIDALVFPAQ